MPMPHFLTPYSPLSQVCDRCEAMKSEIMQKAQDAKGVFQLKVSVGRCEGEVYVRTGA